MKRLTPPLTITALTLLAFWLRAFRLDFQSYWIDEAWTVYFAHLSPAELWHLLQVTEIMPPFYHPSTIYWIKLVGDSEYALRFYSLVFGVMTVPFSYRLGQALGGQRLGFILALLLTVAPYQVWHSQEARMYSILTAASVMSMWGFVKLMQENSRRWWLIYLLGTEWAIMTHYHGAIVIGVQGLFLLITWRRHWRRYLGWAATLLLMLLIYLPWLLFGGNLLQSYTNWIPQASLWEALARSAKAYSLSELVPPAQALPLTLVFVAFYALGLIYAARRTWGRWRGDEMLALLLAYTIAPHLAAWLYGAWRTPVYLERYMIVVQVGFLLTVAIGVLAVAELRVTSYELRIERLKINRINWPAGASLILLVAINGWVLFHHYTDPLYAKPDWRGVVRTVDAFSLPGDAALLTGDGGELAWQFYDRGDVPLHYEFNLLPPTHPDYKKGRPGLAELPQIMTNLTASARRLWFSPYGVEADSALEQWLAQNSYPAWHRWMGRKRLALYYTGPAPAQVDSLNLRLSESLTLLNATRPAAPVAAGDLLPLALTWQTDTTPPGGLQLSLRLVNNRGDIFAQSDWPPLPVAWPVNQPVPDRRSLWLPVDTPPGDYALQLVVYRPADGAPVGPPITLPGFTVLPAPIAVPPKYLDIPNPIVNTLTDTGRKSKIVNPKLLGYVAPDSIQPGQELWLWLYWQAAGPGEAATVRLSLSAGAETSAAAFPLTDALGPLDGWQSGQVRRAVYHLPTSPRLTGDAAQLSVSLLSPAGAVLADVPLAQVGLQTRPRQFEPPALAHPVAVPLGQPPLLTLIGWEAAEPGPILPVTLYWQAAAEMDLNYTVFVQLLNPAGQVAAQVDQPPQGGAAPTTTWLPGEIITDSVTLTLPPDLPPGQYRLITGLYDAVTGQRLPAAGADFVELTRLTLP